MSEITKPTNGILSPGDAAEAIPLLYPPMTPIPSQESASPSVSSATTSAIKPSTSNAPPNVAPMPKRPKGRLFIGGLLLATVGTVAFCFFDSYVRYVAYGEVVGRKIELATPWEGVVSALHVRVGDTVRQGDPVFSIDSIEMRHRMEQIEDSLNLERARIGSELARLKWEAERVEDTQQLVKAEYYEKWSELLWEQSVLADLNQQLLRGEKLNAEGAVPEEKLASLRCRVDGEQRRVEQLTQAVDSLRERLDTDRPIGPQVNDQIKPSLVHIENLQAELRRVRQLLDQGLVTCPANGRVTRIMKYSGEAVDDAASVIELFVDGSAEIVLYVPQGKSQQWSIGDQVDVRIEPANRDLLCEVIRLAPEMKQAPKSIMRHYSADEVLLPMVVRPCDPNLTNQLVLGSKVRLPRLDAGNQMTRIAAWFRRLPEMAAATFSRPPKLRMVPPAHAANRSKLPAPVALR